MIEKTANSKLNSETSLRAALCHAPVTIFALPKAFVGDANQIQKNAFRSWSQLSPAVDVLLFGDEDGIAEFAAEHEIAHVAQIERNENGTPLVGSAFSMAHAVSTSPILVYCNSDVILDRSFTDAMEALANQDQFEHWLAIGQRLDVPIDRELDFENDSQRQWLRRRCDSHGTKSSHVCKEYFAFPRNMFQAVPPFAVGRGNWDNWMVASVKPDGAPVIDLSRQVKAVHQTHDYTHMKASRMKCYVSGEEARENERLAGGRNLISGSTCTHRLGPDGIQKIGLLRAGLDFLGDVPRFAKLMTQLLLSR
ncbi:hypothetical protein [Mariniblastus fucicola]|uniref:Glycosyl transferase family 2 n=1 Tax=Mariniblastus fucicola TaxID=980251 RepID=A0A5B9PF73_9BACT|nr:hypothetical protein [Mariniblastus fucicola]QEG21553.1 hypothetical protein MFFC18_14100 [Mariniblastus fucicola]